jgi:hypothetical protein
VRTPEKQPVVELTPELVRGYADTFINRWDAYPKQRIGKRAYDTIRMPLTLDLVTQHLLGTATTIGAYALSPDSKARWIALDADNGGDWQRFAQMAADLASQGIETRLEQSRAGGHIWFFTQEIDGSLAHRFGKQIAVEYGLPEGIEVFPKQERLRANGVGSFVRLPLGIHQKTGKRYYFVGPGGEPLAPTIREQIALMVSPPQVPVDFILSVAERFDQRWQRRARPEPSQQKYSSKETDSSKPLSEQVKDAISVDMYVERFGGVELDRNLMGLCPFHDDHERSFGVDLSGNPPGWHCFSCGMGGSIIDFEMQMRKQRGLDHSFKATLHEMAKILL